MVLNWDMNWAELNTTAGPEGFHPKPVNKVAADADPEHQNGFDVVGTYTDQFGEPKIILEKKL